MKIYKLNKTLHRDIGYFFVGMILIYAISGIAINHKGDWNPNYIIRNQDFGLGRPVSKSEVDMKLIDTILELADAKGEYKSHYFPDSERLRIFVDGGNITLFLDRGDFKVETILNRPIFKQVNFLHYNPGVLWTWFSDIFCVALAFLAISGLFILKGKYGLVWRGAILVSIGILIPLLFLLIYL
ncbi:MAG: PepSY-associated TM helix domain-containing protein [Candidatus Kapabacteria bacterium]|nr:PepSY-associated TM helix domain-containing protein [Ignavibacteriota bacterium]MCW5886228.1 PepSY-associated TM helix domain-containing protein [Candidatus Kapabacteria bacterium]